MYLFICDLIYIGYELEGRSSIPSGTKRFSSFPQLEDSLCGPLVPIKLGPRVFFLLSFLLLPWPESARELYRASDLWLSAKLVPTSADRGCRVVSATYSLSAAFSDLYTWNRYFFFHVASHLYSRGWMDLIPDTLLPENLIAPRIEPWPLDL
jgi:hypothetical protein